MPNNIFNSIRLGVIAWLDANKESIEENGIKVTIIKNKKDSYVVEFDNDICMAEIVVEEATYAPYRYVSFEVVSIVDSNVKIIYSWYDDETSVLTDIEKELDKGIRFLTNEVKND